MMRSMFSGVSGLRIHQTKMDVIANNIANVNTVGFKSSRVTFSEVFYQKISGASGANDDSGRAGVNAMQIGLGGSVASIDMLMSTGAQQRTDKWDDMMIDGDGFFVVGDNNSNYFTRAGAFMVDEEGYLATPSGLKVMGWDAIPDIINPGQFVIQKGLVQPIVIAGSKEYVDPEATSLISFQDNLNALTDPTQYNTISFYDSVGNRYVVDTRLVYQPSGEWELQMGDIAYPGDDRSKGIPLIVPTTTPPAGAPFELQIGDVNAPLSNPTKFNSIGTLNFDQFGMLTTCVPGSGAGSTTQSFLEFRLTNSVPPGANNSLIPDAVFGDTNANNIQNVIKLDFTNIRQYGTREGNATTSTRDGNPPGKLERVNIGPDGKITGGYSNGMTKLLGQIIVAKFANPAGLEKVGDNLFTTTPNSGDFDGIGQDVQASGGTMRSGVLEMSNVDLSAEFTDLITTQRGFQANSRVITTSDDLLQELVNLKR